MSKNFVWFDNRSSAPEKSVAFYEALLGWKTMPEGPPGMTMFAGGEGPFAGVSDAAGDVKGWIVYAEVKDVDAATERATGLGAKVVAPRTKGPAGDFTVIQDPGGATLALWQRA